MEKINRKKKYILPQIALKYLFSYLYSNAAKKRNEFNLLRFFFFLPQKQLK